MNSLDFAIQMETDGERYYSEQARAYKGSSLSKVFLILAEQERQHLEALWYFADKDVERLPDDHNEHRSRNAFTGLQRKLVVADLPDNRSLLESRNIFLGLEKFQDEIHADPSQVDAYEHALEMEEKSVELYEKLLAEADVDNDKKILRYFVDQEKVHREIMDELVTRIRRPDDWVESAEFGAREEY